MSEHAKIKPWHLHRIAIVYVRQSSAAQVEHNRESTARQYALTQRAAALGWSADRVTVIDEDLGLSGATAHQRNGFARMTAEVIGDEFDVACRALARPRCAPMRTIGLVRRFGLDRL